MELAADRIIAWDINDCKKLRNKTDNHYTKMNKINRLILTKLDKYHPHMMPLWEEKTAAFGQLKQYLLQ